VIADEITQQYGVVVLGRIDEVLDFYYAISVERKFDHPAVLAICETASTALFAT
jgi:LysR family transcriptional activator of nhaA